MKSRIFLPGGEAGNLPRLRSLFFSVSLTLHIWEQNSKYGVVDVTVLVFTTYRKSQYCWSSIFPGTSVLMDVDKLFPLAHFHLLQIDIIYCFQTWITSHWLFVQLQIQSKRLVTMSVSLCTQTGLHHLTVQVLNTRICFLDIWYSSLTSVHYNLEHGIAIITESFSPLNLDLHNLTVRHPYEKWHDKPILVLP